MRGDSRVSRKPDVLHLRSLAEELPNLIPADAEGNVADEEGVALGADDVAMLLGPVLNTVPAVTERLVIVASGSIVEPDGAAINLLASHGVHRRLRGLRVGEVDKAEATAPATLLIGNNTGTHQAIKLAEFPLEPLIINVPAKLSNPERRTLSGLLLRCLGLLRSVLLGLLQLPFPGGLLGLGLFGVFRIGIGAIRVRAVRVGAIRVRLEHC